MSHEREITISPTTRIEGHGKVTILLDKSGNVSDAHFYATEIRGFDYFLRGMEAERLPFIISRICGVCSTAHEIASIKAIESIYGTEITESARKLRELLLMGQIISNHSLVFFFLTLPDFWFSPTLVMEVKGAEITLSPIHTCGHGRIRKQAGLAIRFPRYTGILKEDKAPEDATTTDEMVNMYNLQLKKLE